MSEERFSFRWGIPWLDAGFVQIPSFFFRHYAEAGISCEEFAFVLHLANYKFESPRGQSSPSLETIAKQMGLDVRTIQRLRASLEDKGLLIVEPRPGQTNVYSFENLARRLLQLELADVPDVTGDTGVTPPGDTGVTPLVTPTSPEEQETSRRKQQQQAVDVVSVNVLKSAGEEMLEKIGVLPEAAARLAKQFPLRRIWEVVDAAGQMEGIRNPAAWVVVALEREYQVATSPEEKKGNSGLEASMINCAWRKNKILGPCPTEENGSSWMPWCRVCDHAVAIAPTQPGQ